MTLAWIHENPGRWDENKKAIIGGAAKGIFDTRFQQCAIGDLLPCEWFRVEENGQTVGYGWLDVNWGDAEILLAAAPNAEGKGIGTFILDQLENEAQKRGLNYLFNAVRPTHPHAEKITDWLKKRGFSASEDGRLLRATTRRKT